MYAKTERKYPAGGTARFILEEPTVINLEQDIIFRGVPCRIVSFSYNKKTKEAEDFYAMPLVGNHRIPKYSKYTKIKNK